MCGGKALLVLISKLYDNLLRLTDHQIQEDFLHKKGVLVFSKGGKHLRQESFFGHQKLDILRESVLRTQPCDGYNENILYFHQDSYNESHQPILRHQGDTS